VVLCTSRESRIEAPPQGRTEPASALHRDTWHLTCGSSLVRVNQAEAHPQAGVCVADRRAKITATGVLSMDGQPFAESVSPAGNSMTA